MARAQSNSYEQCIICTVHTEMQVTLFMIMMSAEKNGKWFEFDKIFCRIDFRICRHIHVKHTGSQTPLHHTHTQRKWPIGVATTASTYPFAYTHANCS